MTPHRHGVVVADDGALDLVDLEAGAHAELRPGEDGPVIPRATAVDGGFLVATPTGALLRWRDPIPRAAEDFGTWLHASAPEARPSRR